MTLHKDLRVYSRGIFSCCVCAPVEMPSYEVQAELNAMHPAGWVLSNKTKFQNGTEIPCRCNHTATRQHWLFEN